MKRCPQKCDTKSKANIKQILNSVKLLKKYINSASVAYISAYIQIAELPAAQAVKTKRPLQIFRMMIKYSRVMKRERSLAKQI